MKFNRGITSAIHRTASSKSEEARKSHRIGRSAQRFAVGREAHHCSKSGPNRACHLMMGMTSEEVVAYQNEARKRIRCKTQALKLTKVGTRRQQVCCKNEDDGTGLKADRGLQIVTLVLWTLCRHGNLIEPRVAAFRDGQPEAEVRSTK